MYTVTCTLLYIGRVSQFVHDLLNLLKLLHEESNMMHFTTARTAEGWFCKVRRHIMTSDGSTPAYAQHPDPVSALANCPKPC